MQIIESSVIGVRSAIWLLRARDSQTSIVLFPMIHVAEPEFYAAVTKRLESCDIILYEGVQGKKASRLARIYMQLVKSTKLGLVSQHSMDLSHLRPRMVHADISGDAFDLGWKGLPLGTRVLFTIGPALLGFYWRIFATRQTIAALLGLDDFVVQKDYSDIDLEAFDDLVMTRRDKVLIDTVDAMIEASAGAERSIAIVYGARHMPKLLRHLFKLRGYYPANAEWIDVFGFQNV